MNKKVLYIIMLIALILVFITFNMSRKNKANNITYDVNNSVVEENIIENEIDNIIIAENKTEDTESNILNSNENAQNQKDNSKVNKDNGNNEVNAQNVTSSFDENYFIEGHLKDYPAFGEQYATIIINKIGVNAPIIYGSNNETILNGVGHDSGSYFPGENGSIIMCEHDYLNNFGRLGELVNGDIIEVKTNYGDYYYQVYDEQIVMETETGKLLIQDSEELLMLYTCFNPNNVEHTPYRYVVYSKKI